MMTWFEYEKDFFRRDISSFSSSANQLPSPPSAKAARTSTGYPIFFAILTASFSLPAVLLFAYTTPILSNSLLKSFLSSLISIV